MPIEGLTRGQTSCGGGLGWTHLSLSSLHCLDCLGWRREGREKHVSTEIRGGGSLALADGGDATELSFEGDVQVTGVLARVGQRLMGTVAKTQIDRFFDCLRAKAAEG